MIIMEKKKIVLISHSDVVGGAAIVTSRLMRALRSLGHDAGMVVFAKNGDDPDVKEIGWRCTRGMKFMVERAEIYLKNGRSRENLFKVSTAAHGMAIHRHKLVKEADVVILNWINQGTISLNEIAILAAMGKKIIWTMHDMWCFTGICHHAYDCDHYKRQCGNCRFLKNGGSPSDLSNSVWKAKAEIYRESPIKFVAVSNWLKERALESSLLKNHDIDVIPNAFPVERFNPKTPTKDMWAILNDFKNVIVFGAARVDDPIKGVEHAVNALNILVDTHPEIAATTIAVFFGNVVRDGVFDNLRFPHLACGTIADPTMLLHLYCRATVVLSTSLYETLPGTLIEGQSTGAVPVTFGRGGQGDIIDHKINGYIARYLDDADIAEGIVWAINSGISREALHQSVVDRFSSEAIARRYIDLIDSLD